MYGDIYCTRTFLSLEPTILLARGRNRELWEQPFQACAIDVDYVRRDGQNSVISFVISKWLLPELSIPAAGQKDRRLWGRECAHPIPRSLHLWRMPEMVAPRTFLPQARRIVDSRDENGSTVASRADVLRLVAHA